MRNLAELSLQKASGHLSARKGSTANSRKPPASHSSSTDARARPTGAQSTDDNAEKRDAPGKPALTMQKAVIFEAAPAEERVEGVQGLLPLHRLRARPVDVGSALRGQRVRIRHLRELSVPAQQTHPLMSMLT